MKVTSVCAFCGKRESREVELPYETWFWLTPLADQQRRILVCSEACGTSWFMRRQLEREKEQTERLAYLLAATYRKSDRNCSEWRQWNPGFSPKEHREMMDREWMHNEQKKQTRVNLGVALLAVIVAALGIFFSAKYNIEAARIVADSQRQAADTQIRFQQSLLATPTPVPTITPTPASQPTPGNNVP